MRQTRTSVRWARSHPAQQGSDIAAEFDRKIARHTQARDESASPAVVAAWIAEAEQQRDTALASRPARRETDAAEPMTAQDIACLIAELGDIATALQEAPPGTSSTCTAACTCG